MQHRKFFVGTVSFFGVLLFILVPAGSWYFFLEASADARADPPLAVGLLGKKLTSTKENSIVLGATNLTKDQGKILLCIIPFTISNESNDVIDQITLTFQFPLMLQRQDIEQLLNIKAVSNDNSVKIGHSLSADAKFAYSVYNISNLQPHQVIILDEPFRGWPTVLQVQTEVVSRDGVNISMPLGMIYSVIFEIELSSSKRPTTKYVIHLAFLPAISDKSLYKTVERYLVSENVEKMRRSLGFWRYLLALIRGMPEEKIMILFEETSDQKIGGTKTLFVPEGQPKLQEIVYEPILWNHLFR